MVDGMSMQEAARVFCLDRDMVRKMLAYSVPRFTFFPIALYRTTCSRNKAQRILKLNPILPCP